MLSESKVSLQINLSPGDFPHAVHLLPHQLKILYKQVDEIILTVDTKPSKGRFAEGWYAYQDQLDQFLTIDIRAAYRVKIIPVDYSSEIKKKVATYFFRQNAIPDKDFRGGPFYAYFFGLYMAANDLVFHLDSDVFLGGGSPTWVSEAVSVFKNNASCFITSPLPGTPHVNDVLVGQDIKSKIAPYTYSFNGMSTRLFMVDKSKLIQHKLRLNKPSARNQIKAIIGSNPNADLPEHILSDFMRATGLERIDFLGSGDGLWSLHPPYRTKAFYEQLPALIKRVEQNDLPANQQGFYDMIDEVCDWQEARELISNYRWWKRKTP